MLKKFVLFSFMVLSVQSFAEEHQVNSVNNKKKDSGAGPCAEVKKACEQAGFYKGGHREGKGLTKDCLLPLSQGKSVVGVSVPVEKVSMCSKKRSERKERHSEKHGGDGHKT